ncbi:unnamed protein product [Arctia plantaginis]|uniref:Acyltransferase 3 domain-containing protein n=1 Tax=Arctia plantaginis TaxID=874455 RepID=A0A8S1AKR3_ARCPL|nr:unnamed protein product [Arctia plantaginis]
MNSLFWLLLTAVTATAKEFTDEELSSFPKLFHLDDYDRCLARRDGLYCLGVFNLLPAVQPNPGYDLLKEYSDEFHRHFNRTRIHRGYCVSTRCPNYVTRNASEHFERCVDKYARSRSLRASINTLHYCHNHTDKHAIKPKTPAQNTFLQCIYAIIAINIIGTAYDLWTKDTPNKNKLITSFSIPSNWRRLTVIYEGEDPRLTALTPLNGVRVLSMLLTMLAHSHVLHFSFYTINSEELEKLTEKKRGIFLSDGSCSIQALVTISCFLVCYNLLIFSKKQQLNLSMLPLCIIKRIIRIAPVNLLLVCFGATWWLHIRNSPLVSTTIGLESKACQTKFWAHVFFVNNLVDRGNYCLVPTWFLAVDMHMYLVACIFTLIMWRHRSKAIKLYTIIFLASCTLTGVVTYIMEYKSMIYLSTPEQVRRIFRDSESFVNFYMSSWAAIPSCILGLMLAHLQFELDEKRIKLSEYKWFVYLHYTAFPFIFLWALKGIFTRKYNTTIFIAAHAALDTSCYCLITCIFLLGLIHVNGPLKKLFGWSGWNAMARMSLTVLILHWCVNMIIAARPVAYRTSFLDVTVDWTATIVITYILAIPITVLVELPIQKFMGLLMF